MNAQRIVNVLLDNESPEEFLRDFDLRNLVIDNQPSTKSRGRDLYMVKLRMPGGFLQGIGYIIKDENWNQGWRAYEAFSQMKRDKYAGDYYLGGEWFPTPEEAAIDLKHQWEMT